ncbi:GNAT family N-acetyltransferase [Salinibacterium sp. ZJ70]|uniref:GNAT family N-acetyltransferase n=1 Tax=Salinibacterium sp. ZJ70 TaxID=2708084 RepID=UPI00141F46EF|nr:GNAT family N-acetyltransferase [Salinibacterium sp. ZJ70]
MTGVIRRYRASDLARLREICVLTGAAGGDATGRWTSDDLLPDLFLEPYVTASPDWAWVVDQGDGPVGYLVAVPSTRRFVEWWRAKWSPWFADRFPRLEAPLSPEEELQMRGVEPGILLIPEVDEYPAHFHIDLLPEVQGRGLGRELVEQHLVRALAEADIPGVHVVTDGENVRAGRFYSSLGFEKLPSSTPDGPAFGRWISSRR